MEASRATCPTRDPPPPPLLPPFYVHFISYYYTRALAPVSRSSPPPPSLSLCPPPFLSPPSRLFRNISPLALARRATSSLILPTRSLNKPRGAHETLGGGIVRVSSLCDLCFRNGGTELPCASFGYPIYANCAVAFEERNCGTGES